MSLSGLKCILCQFFLRKLSTAEEDSLKILTELYTVNLSPVRKLAAKYYYQGRNLSTSLIRSEAHKHCQGLSTYHVSSSPRGNQVLKWPNRGDIIIFLNIKIHYIGERDSFYPIKQDSRFFSSINLKFKQD